MHHPPIAVSAERLWTVAKLPTLQLPNILSHIPTANETSTRTLLRAPPFGPHFSSEDSVLSAPLLLAGKQR